MCVQSGLSAAGLTPAQGYRVRVRSGISAVGLNTGLGVQSVCPIRRASCWAKHRFRSTAGVIACTGYQSIACTGYQSIKFRENLT